jgi:hypothetical protein
MKKQPAILTEIQKQSNLLNKEIFIDSESLSRLGVYIVCSSSNNFLGFIICQSKKPEFCIFNNKTLKYAFDEGFELDKIYNAFNSRLFSFIDKDIFLQKLFSND